MRPDVQDCAEFLRMPGGASRDEVVAFYTRAVGLPVMRDYPGIWMLWAGEATAFEIKFDTSPRTFDDTDPATAQLIPVLRTHDLVSTLSRLADAGWFPMSEQVDERARTVYVLGPDKLLIGFAQVSAKSTFAADVEALRRWQTGRPSLPNTPPLAPELQHLSRIELRVADVARSSAFHEAAFGLDCVAIEGDSRVHTLGDTLSLVIAPGGAQRPLPADRFEVTGAILLRTSDLDAVRDDAVAEGARPVGPEVFFEVGVRIQYLADPDGVVTGFIQRTDAGGGEEDYEAMRRWAARAVS